METQEIWKDIPWYEWMYQIHSTWIVRRDWKNISHYICKWYMRVNLYKWWVWKHKLVHRLVAESFLKKESDWLEVNHKNWVKTDNHANNLEWCTKSENIKHAYRTWLKNNNVLRKACSIQVVWENIKTWEKIYFYSSREASRKLSINQSNIWKCCHWKIKTAWWFIWKQIK